MKPIPRSESQRDSDRLKVSEFYLQGWTQAEIAAKLGVHRNTVNSDIKFLLAEWRKQRNGLVDEFEGKYRLIYREAYLAWLDSKKDAETTTQEAIDAGEPIKLDKQGNPLPVTQRLKVSTRREGQSGNPALLAQAQAALKAIREMFGVDAATKLELGGKVELGHTIDQALKTAWGIAPKDKPVADNSDD